MDFMENIGFTDVFGLHPSKILVKPMLSVNWVLPATLPSCEQTTENRNPRDKKKQPSNAKSASSCSRVTSQEQKMVGTWGGGGHHTYIYIYILREFASYMSRDLFDFFEFLFSFVRFFLDIGNDKCFNFELGILRVRNYVFVFGRILDAI